MNDLARVARATNQAEAEFVQSLLLDAGIPSMLRRSPGFDVPDMLAAGPRDVMVPSAAHDAARDVLLQAEIVTEDRAVVDPRTRERLPARALRTAPRGHADLPPGRGSLTGESLARRHRRRSGLRLGWNSGMHSACTRIDEKHRLAGTSDAAGCNRPRHADYDCAALWLYRAKTRGWGIQKGTQQQTDSARSVTEAGQAWVLMQAPASRPRRAPRWHRSGRPCSWESRARVP